MTHNNRLIVVLFVLMAISLFLGWYIGFIELVRPWYIFIELVRP